MTSVLKCEINKNQQYFEHYITFKYFFVSLATAVAHYAMLKALNKCLYLSEYHTCLLSLCITDKHVAFEYVYECII